MEMRCNLRAKLSVEMKLLGSPYNKYKCITIS